MSPETVARTVRVHGLVQGVCFRDSCRREAVRHQVTGWIRNDYDGSVHACFEGAPDTVEAMVAWCRVGPSHAHVERVDVEDQASTGRTTFEILG